MVTIQGLSFQGPWPLGTSFKDVPGVYVIYTNQQWLDVGETEALGQRLNGESHERKPDWIRNAHSLPVNIAFLGVGSAQRRLMIEASLRQSLCPQCGER